MMNVLTIAVGVALGSLMTSGLAIVLMLNKKVLKKFMERYMKLVVDVSNEIDYESIMEKDA